MTVFNLYIYNRDGTLIFYQEWVRKKPMTMSLEEESRLLYGMLFSLKSFSNRISPLDVQEGVRCYTTNKYKMTLYETPTSVKFVCNTDVNAPGVNEMLQKLYTQVYVEYVIRNPECKPAEPINSELFKAKLDEAVKTSPAFTSKAA